MRIGLVGFGFIGADLYRRIAASDGDVELAFVHNRTAARLADVRRALVLDDPGDAARFAPDLIVEAADPGITRRYGEAFLGFADYMPLSLTALADDGLRGRLEGAAARSGRSLLVAHGALVGMDSLVEWRDAWEEVTISFRKPPASLGLPGATAETLLFDGSVREIAARYPHNVNAMVACALATVGLDRCRARLVADPALDHLVLEVEARGCDGARVSIRRSQPATGVSGSEMAASAWRSICRAAPLPGGLVFV